MADKQIKQFEPKKQNIQPRPLVEEMQESYLSYAMSVIMARALPDVRDGLKPVHRRILYAMHRMGLNSSSRFRKSAAITGETMGKYHPHGNAAIYDAMARMAQNFSMRYPLVWGQGNFGCFTKDTKVRLVDGRSRTFVELIKEDKEGMQNYTFTVKDGKVAIAPIKKPRLTRKDAEIMKVVLDNGEEIKCTPDHKFLLKNGIYVEAQNLKKGISLMPLYARLSAVEDAPVRQMLGYEMVFQPNHDDWDFVHHLADAYNIEHGNYTVQAGKVRHHIDHNKLNNNPDNIQRMQWRDHWQLHSELASERHKNDSEYVTKLAKGREEFWKKKENREQYAKRLSIKNKKNWKDPKYRKKMIKTLSEVNTRYVQKHPEVRKEMSIRATRTLKKLWKNPEYRAFMNERISKGNKNRITNRTGKKKFYTICHEVINSGKPLSEKTYEQARLQVYPYGHATLWGTGLQKYYGGDPERVKVEINANHRVKDIVFLKEREDVYDLTIDHTRNFALAAGVFVHNSIDGDNPAAERYTEAKLMPISSLMLEDIDKDTVEWMDNYDGEHKEPRVLPAALPQLLLNGTLGIAVGMATNIPPHNLKEVIDATVHLLASPKSTTEDLMQFIQGPDFPLGGIIYNKRAILEAYGQGKGPIIMRGKAEIKESTKKSKKGGRFIEISEIPYQVNKSTLIEKMAELVQSGKLDSVRDIRDESDRQNPVRIIIEFKKDSQPQKTLNKLYEYTELQKTFHLNMTALADGVQPQVLNLKEVLEKYLQHKREVLKRRIQYDLTKAKERAHILEGLKKALDNIDKVISTIKKSKDRKDAHKNLKTIFKFTDMQATAILDMRLHNLANLERQQVDDELKEKKALVKEYEELLKSEVKIKSQIKKELMEVSKKYGDERRTKVYATAVGKFSEEDLVPKEETIISMTRDSYIKRVSPSAYKVQHRGGRGIIGMETRGDDVVGQFLSASTHDRLLFFTNTGRVFQALAYEIPSSTRTARGKALVNFLDLQKDEFVTTIVPLTRGEKSAAKEGSYLVMVTENGILKKTLAKDFENVRRSGLIAIRLKKGDKLNWVGVSSGSDEIILTTKNGQNIRFSEKDVRSMGRSASGVKGINLKVNDRVIGSDIIKVDDRDKNLLIIMANGYGKQTSLKLFKQQKRGGSGIKAASVTQKTGEVVGVVVARDAEELIAISQNGHVIRVLVKKISRLGRATQGVRIMRLLSGDNVASIALV